MWQPELIPWYEYDQLVRSRLKPSRYEHSICVMKRAVQLAERFGADVTRARLAGLLHDIMKNVEPKEMLQFIEDSGIILLYADMCAPQLWHAIAGAAYIRRELHIDDGEVINAVRYHTTGRAGMSLLEKVVYLADLTSADRDYSDVKKTRRIVDRSLDEGMLYSMKFLITDLVKDCRVLHPDSLACYDELVRNGIHVD